MTEKLGILFSTGKDSVYAMHKMKEKGHEIACLITIQSKNKDSYMFHTPSTELAKYQAEALELPLILWETEGKKEEELKDLKNAIQEAKNKYNIQGVCTGALFSTYQKNRIEKICEELGIKVFSPLWHIDQYKEMNELIEKDYEFIFTKIACEGLDKDWLGVKIDLNILEKLQKVNSKTKINIAGEGGEFESFVLDSPMFKKKLEIVKSKIIESSENCAELFIEEIKLVKK